MSAVVDPLTTIQRAWERARTLALGYGYTELVAQLLAGEVQRRVAAGEWLGRALADVVRPRHYAAHGYRRPTSPTSPEAA